MWDVIKGFQWRLHMCFHKTSIITGSWFGTEFFSFSNRFAVGTVTISADAGSVS